MTHPYLIGIAGASGAGKTALAHRLAGRLADRPTPVIPIDAYYRDRAALSDEMRVALNYDEPKAIDVELLLKHLRCLAVGQAIKQPVYGFQGHTRADGTERVEPGRFVIVEGVLALHWPELLELLHTLAFIVANESTCLARRLARDMSERGRTEASVRAQWATTVQPMYARYAAPTRQLADVVVNGADAPEKNVTRILEHVQRIARI